MSPLSALKIYTGGREMTNKEKYLEEILDIVISDASIGIDKKTGNLASCGSEIDCMWSKI